VGRHCTDKTPISRIGAGASSFIEAASPIALGSGQDAMEANQTATELAFVLTGIAF
jgi:hypothetical protein